MSEAKIVIRATDDTSAAFSSVQKKFRKMDSFIFGNSKSLDKLKQKFSDTFPHATKLVGKLNLGLAAAAGAAGLGAFVVMSSKAKLETYAFAEAMGASNQELLAWNYALEGSGIEGEKLASIWRDSAEKIGEAFSSGGGEAAEVLERLNLKASDLVKLSPEQKLLAVGEAMKSVKSNDERIYLMESLASDASQLLPYITDNSEEFKRLTEEAKATGAAITDIDAAKLQAANVSLSRSAQIMSGVGARIAASFAPYIEAISTWFAEMAKKHNGFKDEIISGTKSIIKGVAFLADVWRGLKTVWAGLEVAFWGSAYGLLKGIGRLGAAIEMVLNMLPGVEVHGSRYFNNLASTASKKMGEAGEAFDELINRPMPSQKVEAFFNEIEAKANAKAAEYTSGKKKSLLKTITGGADEKEQQETLQKMQDTQQAKYAQMIQGFAGEMELTYIHEAEKRAFLDESLASNAITAQQHETALTLIAQEGAEARAALAEKERQHKLAVYQGMMGNLTALMASGSKTQFMFGKRAAQANALLSAKESIVHSYKEGAKVGGPPLGYAYAVTAGLATAAQIADLENTTFSGGGSISPSGGGGVSAGGGQPPVAPVPPALSGAAKQGSGSTTTFNLIGNEDTTYTHAQVLSMMQGMKTAIRDGDEILIETGTRQAQELTA